MANKEKNFISAVVYLGEEKAYARSFLASLCERLAARFENYELIFVEDAARDGTEAEVREFLEGMKQLPPVTMIHMSLKQGLELAMNAGLDLAIGDFVYEFDTMKMPYPETMVDDAYDACVGGSDIVSVAPGKNRKLSSSLFYGMFNSASHSKYKLRTDVFRILSRRAINRVHGISETLVYRKAAYAASGLKLQTLVYPGKSGRENEKLRVSRAADSLALYTGIGYKMALGVSMFMLLLMVAAVVYTLVVNITRAGGADPVAAGWTTTMLVLTGGFAGVFLLLAMVLKYLSLLVDLIFKKQKYLVESVEKIT